MTDLRIGTPSVSDAPEQSGIGLLILQYNQSLNIPAAYSLLFILCAAGVSVSMAMRYLEHKFCFWAQRERENLATEEG